jgi:hypothetical protein
VQANDPSSLRERVRQGIEAKPNDQKRKYATEQRRAPIPSASASTKDPETSSSDTRFETVIVKRSLEAANAISVGKKIV